MMEDNEKRALYDYITTHFVLSRDYAKRLVENIITYVAAQGFVDLEDNVSHLYSMLEAIGITEDEIRNAISIEVVDAPDDSMEDTYTCDICGFRSKWEAEEDLNEGGHGSLWGCDKCGGTFCSKCFIERHGLKNYWNMMQNMSNVYCPDCYEKTAKEGILA